MGIVAGVCMADTSRLNDLEWENKCLADQVDSLVKKSQDVNIWQTGITTQISNCESNLLQINTYKAQAQSARNASVALPAATKAESQVLQQKQNLTLALNRSKLEAIRLNEEEKAVNRRIKMNQTQQGLEQGKNKKGDEIIKSSIERFFGGGGR